MTWKALGIPVLSWNVPHIFLTKLGCRAKNNYCPPASVQLLALNNFKSFDICQDLRGGSKRMYLGGVPPNTPPYSQWGALIYAGTAGDSRRCQKGTGLPKM